MLYLYCSYRLKADIQCYTCTVSCRLKADIAGKYGLSTQPRLVDIIAAVPLTHKKTLLPKLKVLIFFISYYA